MFVLFAICAALVSSLVASQGIVSMSTSKKPTNSGGQPTIVQSIQSSAEARTRLQKAKLARSPDMEEFAGPEENPHEVTEDVGVQSKTADLFTTLRQVQTSLSSMEKQIGEVTQLQGEIVSLKKNQALLTKEAKQAKFKANMLTNVVIRLEEKLELQAEKITQMQARSMRKNLIISGVDDDEPPQVETTYSLTQKVNKLMVEKLKMKEPAQLKACHRFGQPDASGVRPVVIKVQDIDDKFAILAKGPNLKDCVNKNGKKYYISEQLPDKLQEEKRYNQYWVQENKHNPQSKLEMKITRNRLRINNQPYVRKVQTPTAAEILRLDDHELSSARHVRLYEGGSKLHGGSEFLAFAARVDTIEDVRNAYRKLKVKYADASHISSAHRFDPPQGPFNQEAHDDHEYGMGRTLLKILQENNMANAAVFVIRYFGGVHIGTVRFGIAKELASKALKSAGFLTTPAQKSGSAPRRKAQPSRFSPSAAVTSASDTEPEVVTQYKRKFPEQSRGVNDNYVTNDTENETVSSVGQTRSENEYDASHDEDTDEFDEARSQTGSDQIQLGVPNSMPPLETTQEQRTMADNFALMRQRTVQESAIAEAS